MPAEVDYANPDAVSSAALVSLYSYDTTIDNGPNDTAQRALPFLSGALAEGITEERPVAGPGAEWLEWASHQAYVTVTVSPLDEDRPLDTAVEAYRQYDIALHPTGRDGWTGSDDTLTAFVVLTNDGNRWLVDEVNPAE